MFLGMGTFLAISVQDFRDIAGDRAAGRRTMPIVWGQRRARFKHPATCTGSAIIYALN